LLVVLVWLYLASATRHEQPSTANSKRRKIKREVWMVAIFAVSNLGGGGGVGDKENDNKNSVGLFTIIPLCTACLERHLRDRQ
jgi:hypothetical protein